MGRPGLLGINKVMKNLNLEIGKMKIRGTTGLIESSIVIRRDMDKRPPLIPVDLGNLRASWFTTIGSRQPDPGGNFIGKGSGKLRGNHTGVVASASAKASSFIFPVIIMGFSANYSVFIHEMDFKKGNRPGSGPKFFESSLKRNTKVILTILKKNIKRS